MKYYTIKEVADLLNLHSQSIRRYIKRKKLKAYLFGNKYKISQSDLDEFLETLKV